MYEWKYRHCSTPRPTASDQSKATNQLSANLVSRGPTDTLARARFGLRNVVARHYHSTVVQYNDNIKNSNIVKANAALISEPIAVAYVTGTSARR